MTARWSIVPERRAVAHLALIGLACAWLCALLAQQYPLVSGLQNPRAGWKELTQPTPWTPIGHTAIYLGLTLLYLGALRLSIRAPGTPVNRNVRAQRLIVILTWLVCSAILMTAAPGGESHDIFDYIFRGRMMTELGANPLTEAPIQYRSEPYFSYLAWHGHVDTYGPLWEMASATVAGVIRELLKAGGVWLDQNPSCPNSPTSCLSLVIYITGYRLLAVALTAASAVLIASMLRRRQPHLIGAALTAWLWSPIVLISTAIGAHNDALMIALLMLMLWSLQRGDTRGIASAILAFVLAAHVKLSVLLITPVIGSWLARQRGWRSALLLSALAATTTLVLSSLLYAPFGGWDSLPRMLRERAAFLANSPWQLLNRLLLTRFAWNGEAARQLTVQMSSWLFAGASALMSLWMLGFRPGRWQSRSASGADDDPLLWRATAWVTLLYLFVGGFWFQHWYVVWAVAPAALRPDARLTRFALPWLGFGALTANMLSAYLATTLSPTTADAVIVATIWTPAVIACGLCARRFREKARASRHSSQM